LSKRFSTIVSIAFSILASSLIIPVLLLMNLLGFDLNFFGILFFLFSILGIRVTVRNKSTSR
jgi:hypothetical protein